MVNPGLPGGSARWATCCLHVAPLHRIPAHRPALPRGSASRCGSEWIPPRLVRLRERGAAISQTATSWPNRIGARWAVAMRSGSITLGISSLQPRCASRSAAQIRLVTQSSGGCKLETRPWSSASRREASFDQATMLSRRSFLMTARSIRRHVRSPHSRKDRASASSPKGSCERC
jgi:hypothetical protein